jgi:hypothetical protein
MNDWEQRLAEQEARLHAAIPSSEDELSAKAMARLSAIKMQLYDAGRKLRATKSKDGVAALTDRLSTMAVPGREHVAQLPWLSKASGFMSLLRDPIRNAGQRIDLKLHDRLNERQLAPTDSKQDPSELLWYYPALAVGAPRALASGWHDAGKQLMQQRHAKLDSDLAAAKAEFEAALKEEYNAAKGVKAASAGELIDQWADTLYKAADTGILDKLLRAYATAASVGGLGSYELGRQWAHEHDPRQAEMEAIEETLFRRAQKKPPLVTVSLPNVAPAGTAAPAEV